MAKIFKPGRSPRSAGRDELLSLRVERLGDDGRGIARHGDKVVFVADALPGEEIRAKRVRRHKRFDEARCVERLNRSADRVEPSCIHYQDCGGCQLQHLDYPAQLGHKQQRLAGLLGGGQEPELISGSPLGYRHRARLSYRAGHLGFKSAASHHIVDIACCPVLEPKLEAAVLALREPLLQQLKQSHRAELLFSLSADGRVGLAVEDERRRSSSWCQALAEQIEQYAELHQVTSPDGVWRAELPALRYSKARHSVAFSPADFTQANRQLNEELVARSLAWLDVSPGEEVIDYFCGLGNFSLPLAAAGAKVLAIDAGEEMLERARSRAQALSLELEFACANLFEAEQIPLRRATAALLDPPRAGARALCEAIASSDHIQRLVYVSCDPATLARDVARLVEGGFSVQRLAMADMFPHTHHMESLVLLIRG